MGLEVKYLSDSSMLLIQAKYVQDLLSRTNMLNCSAISTPMVANNKLSRHGTDKLSDPT